jgi:hypothetical protein
MQSRTDTTPQLIQFCPECGSGVGSLNSATGFCDDCSYLVTGKRVCESCGNEFTPYQTSRTTCTECRRLEWYRRNADAIERVMATKFVTVFIAVGIVHDDNRPRCVMCGDDIKHGTKGRTLFCTKRDACRRASIRYNRYRKRNKMTDDEALEKVLNGKR